MLSASLSLITDPHLAERPSPDVCYALYLATLASNPNDPTDYFFCPANEQCLAVKCTLCRGYPKTPVITASSVSDDYVCRALTDEAFGLECGTPPYDLDTPYFCTQHTLNTDYSQRCVSDCRLCTGFTLDPLPGTKLCRRT